MELCSYLSVVIRKSSRFLISDCGLKNANGKMDRKLVIFAVFLIGFSSANGLLRRCYSCRSRGELGSCKDPFKTNSTQGEKEKGIEAVPCASGWCSKIIESVNSDEYGIATERQCLPRGPSDSEERCANTEWNHKKVYMCFCQGDLCNSAVSIPYITPIVYSLILVFIQYSLLFRNT